MKTLEENIPTGAEVLNDRIRCYVNISEEEYSRIERLAAAEGLSVDMYLALYLSSHPTKEKGPLKI